MNNIMEILKSLEENDLLIEGINETIKNEAKEQFLGMLFDISGASLLGNLLTGKGAVRAGKRAVATSQGQSTSSFNKFWNTKCYQS